MAKLISIISRFPNHESNNIYHHEHQSHLSYLKTKPSQTINMQNEKGQGVSHATGSSSVPQKVQEKVKIPPLHLSPSPELTLPGPFKPRTRTPRLRPHDTNSNKDTGKVSHATGDSIVPQALQEALPEKVEKAVPNAIHDTGDKK